MGLSSAVNCINKWGGRCEILSQIIKGTIINIYLPISEPADWFSNCIPLNNIKHIVVLDDEKYIYEIWKNKLSQYENNLNVDLIYHKHPDTFITKVDAHDDQTLYLIEHEIIGYNLTGTDIIESHHLAKCSFLVTNNYDEIELRDRCIKLGIRIIPKKWALFIPFIFSKYN